MRTELGRRRRFRAAPWLALLLLAGAGLGGCAQTNDGGSGETHFLTTCDEGCPGALSCVCGVCTTGCSDDDACGELGGSCLAADCTAASRVCDLACSSDADCGELGANHRCQAGRCRDTGSTSPLRDDAGTGDAATPGSDGGPMLPDAATALNCAPGCTPSRGYPVDEARGCVDTSASEEVACNCGDPGPMACRIRLADGSPWVVPQLNLDPPEAWGMCDPVSLGSASSTSCEFLHCDIPPASLCSLDDTCAAGKCGGFQYYDDGCRRRSCTTDAECDDGDRCLALACVDSSFCSYSPEGACQCGGTLACVFGNACAPVAQVGPAGDWVSLRIDEWWGPCPPTEICMATWTVTPDGSISYEGQQGAGTATLAGFELDDLRRMVDGPELRLGLETGPACLLPPTDFGVSMTLELSTGSLDNDIGGCVTEGPEGNVFDRVYQLLSQATQ